MTNVSPATPQSGAGGTVTVKDVTAKIAKDAVSSVATKMLKQATAQSFSQLSDMVKKKEK